MIEKKLSALAAGLLCNWQRDFPLVPAPFADIARSAGCNETDVISEYQKLVSIGCLSRIGAIVAPNTLGASTLAALSVPPGETTRIAALMSTIEGISHNYERENTLNIWFVMTAPDAKTLSSRLGDVEAITGCRVYSFHMERAYHLDLGFPLHDQPTREKRVRAENPQLDAIRPGDQQLAAVLESGLPLIRRPFRAVAMELGWGEHRVFERLRALQEANVLRRFGTVIMHRQLGYQANAMAVWDIPDENVDAVGEEMAKVPGVSLCYRRNRHPERWPFNLYCMVHSKFRDQAGQIIKRIDSTVEPWSRDHRVLFSTRCFKQRGASFATAGI